MAEQTTGNQKQKKDVRKFLGGTILIDQRIRRFLPYVLFLVFLGLILIANRNAAQKKIRRIEALQDSIKELRSESIAVSARLMDISRPSEVIRKIKNAGIGLEEPVTPPRKIIVTED
jgi:hypothetical protein